jgi:hypothetical protein
MPVTIAATADMTARAVVAEDSDCVAEEVVDLVPGVASTWATTARLRRCRLSAVVHDRAPSISALVANQAPMPDTSSARSWAMVGVSSSTATLSVVSGSDRGRRVDRLVCAASTEEPISSACAVRPDGCDQDDGHQGEQAEHDQASGDAGLEPVAFEDSDQRRRSGWPRTSAGRSRSPPAVRRPP